VFHCQSFSYYFGVTIVAQGAGNITSTVVQVERQLQDLELIQASVGSCNHCMFIHGSVSPYSPPVIFTILFTMKTEDFQYPNSKTVKNWRNTLILMTILATYLVVN